MNLYLAIKWLHVVSSVVLVGVGAGSAFYLYCVNRSDEIAAQSVVCRLVVRADAWFTTPAVVLQPATGMLLAHLSGLPLSTPWLAISFGLFLAAVGCWLPVVWLQIRMAAMAGEAHRAGKPLPPRYWRFARRWELLGYPAFVALLVVFYLMVAKPDFIR